LPSASMKNDLLRLLARHRITLRAELDQEHIVDPNLISEMVALAEVGRDDVVLEVGSGLGNITESIAEIAKRVYAIEKYRQFAPILRAKFRGRRNVELIFDNVLNIRLPPFDKIVSNLPFSICEGLLQKLALCDFKMGALIVPMPFAQTIAARPGDPKASKLSLLTSAFFDVKVEKAVEPDAFFPAPGFRCALLKLMPFDTKDMMTIITRHVLVQRDKKAKNALRTALIDAHKSCNKPISKLEARKMVEALNLEPSIGESKIAALSVGQIVRINRALRGQL